MSKLSDDLYGDAPAPGASDHKYSEDSNRALDALTARVKALAVQDAFDPNQPRDAKGQWTGGKSVDISTLRSSQPSSETNKSRVSFYREQIRSGEKLPPITVVRVRETGENRVIDGHHRMLAAKAEKLRKVNVDVVHSVTKSKDATAYYRAMRFMDEHEHSPVPINNDGRILDGDELRDLKMFRQRRRP